MKDKLEIERKILGVPLKRLLERIKTLKPKPKLAFSGMVRVEYWDFSDCRIRNKKDLLRLREFYPTKGKSYTEFVYKTHKGVHEGSKHYEEAEVKIEGCLMNLIGRILAKIGLRRTCLYEKKRTVFVYKDVHLEVDEHPKIPAFLEIEAPSSKRIDEIIRLLGLEAYEQTADSISALLKRKYPKIKLNGLVFKKI